MKKILPPPPPPQPPVTDEDLLNKELRVLGAFIWYCWGGLGVCLALIVAHLFRH